MTNDQDKDQKIAKLQQQVHEDQAKQVPFWKTNSFDS